MRRFLFLFLGWAQVCGAFSLTDMLVHVYKNNQELKAAQKSVLAGHEKMPQAYASWRPNITARGSTNASEQRDRGDFVNNAGTALTRSKKLGGGIEARQNLFAGGKTAAGIKIAEAEIRASWVQLKQKEQEIFLQAIKVYLDIVAKNAEIRLHQATVKATQKSKEFATSKLTVGEGSRTQVKAAEGRLADAQAQLENAKVSLEALKATFEYLTGVPAPAHFDPGTFLGALPVNISAFLESVRDNNPSIIYALFSYQSALASIDAAIGSFLPRIDAVASGGWNKNWAKQSLKDAYAPQNGVTRTTSIGIEATVPLYQGGELRSKKREAAEAAAVKKIVIEKEKLNAIQNATQFWEGYNTALLNIEIYKRQVEAYKIRLEGTQQEMEAGTLVMLDVLNALSELLQAELKRVEAEKNALYYAYQILSVMGQLDAKSLRLPVDYFDPEPHYRTTSQRF